MKKIFLLVLSIFLVQLSVSAQSYSWEEHIYAHLSKGITTTGDAVWFTLEVSSTSPEFTPSIAYAELVDRNGNPVEQMIIPLEKGEAEGKIQIPSNISSDHYLIRFYTRTSPYLSNQGTFNQFITVINPEKPVNYAVSKAKPTGFNFIKAQEVNMTSAKVVGKKKGAQLNPNVKGNSEKRIISIAIENPFLEEDLQGIVQSEIYDLNSSGQQLIPEPFGHILKAKDSNPKENDVYYVSAHGNTNSFNTAIPNADGELFFDLAAVKDFNFLLAQKSDLNDALNFEIQSPFIALKFKKDFIFPSLELNPKHEDFLNTLVLASRLSEYYHAPENLGFQPISTALIADKTYFLDDYVRFETVETTLKEYVPHVFVRKRDRNTLFKVLNEPREVIFTENPLLLIDNMPIFNADDFAAFNPKDILKIDLITRMFYFNNQIHYGVISLSSKNNDFGGFELPKTALYLDYYKFSPKITAKSPNVNDRLTDERVPDFRNLLYWNTAVKESEEIQISSSETAASYAVWMSQKVNGKWTIYKDYLEVR